jgi:hypothetical protein
MDKELTEIARQLTELEGFEWAAGMIDETGVTVLKVHKDGTITTSEMVSRCRGYESYDELENGPPEIVLLCSVLDLCASQNGGILLEALGPGYILGIPRAGLWSIAHLYGTTLHEGPTLAEACARALIARGYYRRREG